MKLEVPAIYLGNTCKEKWGWQSTQNPVGETGDGGKRQFSTAVQCVWKSLSKTRAEPQLPFQEVSGPSVMPGLWIGTVMGVLGPRHRCANGF